MSEPTVTSTSDNHSANVSKPHPHSVAHESVPPESRPVGQEEHATTGPDDKPPGAAEGEDYPPQKHAGQVGLGPHYAEVHGKEAGFGAKLTGMKEQLKGKVTRNHELEQRGHDRTTGELKAKEQAQDDAKSPFNTAGADDKSDQKPDEKADKKVDEKVDEKPTTEGTPVPPNAPTTNPAEKVASHEGTTAGTPAAATTGPTTDKATPH